MEESTERKTSTRKSSPKKEEKEVLLYEENVYTTQNLRSQGLPYCKICGSGFKTDLNREKFCPNKKPDCPMLNL